MGANSHIITKTYSCAVSIHAPVMGAKVKLRAVDCIGGFNPRTRDGCEMRTASIFFYYIVSIHAPVMGANLGGRNRWGTLEVSIHAPVMGANIQ